MPPPACGDSVTPERQRGASPGRSGPRIKVCGVTTVADAVAAADLGADLIGVNFYPPSPRYVDGRRARSIADALRALDRPPKLVGVFVGASVAAIRAIDDAVGLDYVQLHGDEAPELVAAFGRRAIKVLHARGSFDPALAAPFLGAGDGPFAFLVDTDHPALWGGSGEAWQHHSLRAADLGRPVLVAGGLSPGNVRAAVRESGAWGVDVCSGIESSPGIKDRVLMARFFEEALHGPIPLAP